jgi:hypothetical protein
VVLLFLCHSFFVCLEFIPLNLDFFFKIALDLFENMLHVLRQFLVNNPNHIILTFKFHSILCSHVCEHTSDVLQIAFSGLHLMRLTSLYILWVHLLILQVLLLVSVFHLQILLKYLLKPELIVLSQSKSLKLVVTLSYHVMHVLLYQVVFMSLIIVILVLRVILRLLMSTWNVLSLEQQ